MIGREDFPNQMGHSPHRLVTVLSTHVRVEGPLPGLPSNTSVTAPSPLAGAHKALPTPRPQELTQKGPLCKAQYKGFI